MKNIELNEKVLEGADKKLIYNFKKYKNYNTIRRDLREAYFLIENIIQFRNKMMRDELTEQDEIAMKSDKVGIYKLYFFQAVILYARWFKHTDEKPQLSVNKYFNDNNENLLNAHNYIISLRDRYIAHNEEDLLGGDNVSAEIDNFGNVKITSNWEAKHWPSEKELKLEDMLECIKIVHNEIDSKEIPKYETYLKNGLEEFLKSRH